MERIKLNLTPDFPFETTIPIRITDVNYGGHVGNDTFLSLIHEARQQFLYHFGYSELSIEGAGLIMLDVAIEFKKELHYGDAVIIKVAAVNFDKVGFDMHYQLQVEQQGQRHMAAKAKTGMACFDYSTRKIVAVPAAAIQQLTGSK